jgi:hypothetical protein
MSGAGMQTADLYKLAYNQNTKVVMVGGECAVSVQISRSLEFCDRLTDICKDCGIGSRICPRRRPWPIGVVYYNILGTSKSAEHNANLKTLSMSPLFLSITM